MEIKTEVDRYLEGKQILADWKPFGFFIHFWDDRLDTALNTHFPGKHLTEEMYRVLAAIQFASVDIQSSDEKTNLWMDEVCKWIDNGGCLYDVSETNDDDCVMLPDSIDNVLTPYIIVAASY